MYQNRYPVKVDLHIHTVHSDGTSCQRDSGSCIPPGLKAVSITDHDCTDAYPLAQELGGEVLSYSRS